MLTRCPHCQTAFRVTPEQLKARQGRVRCGECRAVFDALDTLADEAPAPVAAPHAPSETPLASTAAAATPPLAPAPVIAAEFAPEPEPESEPLAEPEPEPPVEPASPAAPSSSPLAVSETAATMIAPDADPPAQPAARAAPENLPAPDDAPPANPLPAAEIPEIAAIAAATAAEEPAAWENPEAPPPKRWPWLIGLLVLLVLAGGQLLFIFRVELAVLAPEARPALVAGCELLGCTLPRPRKPELVGIEASDLAPADGDHLLLTATLKNRAPFDQEYPHLELTLTDMQDAALLRKVLTPADYLPKGRQPADGFPARDELAVKLTLAAPGVPAAGYRLYLFYP